MKPFVFVLKVKIPKNGKTTSRQFIFIDRKEAEHFRTLIAKFGAHVTEITGFVPSSADTAMRKVLEEINRPSPKVEIDGPVPAL